MSEGIANRQSPIAEPRLKGCPLLTPEEAAAALRISERSLRDYTRKRMITSCKYGGKRVYEQWAIEEFLARHRDLAVGEHAPQTKQSESRYL